MHRAIKNAKTTLFNITSNSDFTFELVSGKLNIKKYMYI